jgi:hypothetical protein
MKYLYYLVVLILTTATLTAQKVKLKKEIVYFNDVRAFSFEKKSMGNELYVYKLETKEELFNFMVDNNKTESKVDDSKRIVFTKQNTTIASKDFQGRNYEFLIALLLEEKVVNLKGEINLDNLIRFKARYDDGNINHTNKH